MENYCNSILKRYAPLIEYYASNHREDIWKGYYTSDSGTRGRIHCYFAAPLGATPTDANKEFNQVLVNKYIQNKVWRRTYTLPQA